MTEAARAEYLASEEGQRALMLSLLRQVADAYLQLLQLDEQLAIVQKSVESYSACERLFVEQLEGEVGDMLQVSSAKAALASAQAQIPAIQSQIASLENTISILAGRTPGPIRRSGSLRDMAYNIDVPAGIPAYILSRRPDVRQSEYKLRSANASIGIAIANYFPSISLTGAGGLASSDLRQVQGRRGGWGVGANLSGPIFQAGKLRASEKMARAEFEAAKNDYEQTVLNALSEVSSTLIQRTKLRDITTHQATAVEAYRKAVELSFEKFRIGESNYIEVLYAQQNLYPAQIQLSQYHYQHASTLVSLYTALGGGWNMSHKAIIDGPSK
jgi:multidrug efflux system outer membrane protein